MGPPSRATVMGQPREVKDFALAKLAKVSKRI